MLRLVLAQCLGLCMLQTLVSHNDVLSARSTLLNSMRLSFLVLSEPSIASEQCEASC